MEGRRLTEFGLAVKTELLRRGRDQKWLAEKLRQDTGLYVDSAYLYKILTGQRKAARVAQAIRTVLGLEKV